MVIEFNFNILDCFLCGLIGIGVIVFVLFNGDIIDDVFIEILFGIFGILNLILLVLGWCLVYYIVGISMCK